MQAVEAAFEKDLVILDNIVRVNEPPDTKSDETKFKIQ
jgi:hypothetical protein